jgi:hypothetical protein
LVADFLKEKEELLLDFQLSMTFDRLRRIRNVSTGAAQILTLKAAGLDPLSKNSSFNQRMYK